MLGCNYIHPALSALGQFELNGKKKRICMVGNCEHLVPAACKSCGPTHLSCVLASCVVDGPIRAMCRISWCVEMDAWVQFCSSCSGPIRAHRQDAVRLHGGPPGAFSVGSHPAVYKSCGPTNQSRVQPSCVIDGPTRAMCCTLLSVEVGLCECLGAIIFALLWANSSSSASSCAFAWWATASI
jgi:hypothetical protein